MAMAQNAVGMLQTPAFAHYAISWSPYHPNRLALASAANYGLVGNGRLHLVSLTPSPRGIDLTLDKGFETQDGLYDVAWSEAHENQIVSTSGDGSLRLWDITLKDLPIRVWQEHSREVYSVDWSNLRKDQFASSSWDGLVKIWRPDFPRSMTTIQAHHACVYQALFSPHQPDLLATCSTDGTVRLFDLRSPLSSSHPTSHIKPITPASLTIPASGGEVLSVDWNKYRQFVLASAGVDKSIKIWDARMITNAATAGPQVGGPCENELRGHEYAVRRVQWSPHSAEFLASASYDMTCRIWNAAAKAPQPSLLHIQDAHTEFVSGCAWSLFDKGLLGTCGWDARMHLLRL